MQAVQKFEFHQVYREWHPKILHYLTALVGGNEAEDVAQDVFLKIHAHLSEFEGRSALSTWLYRIATHTALDRLRSPGIRQRQQEVAWQQMDAAPEIASASLLDPALSVQQELVQQEASACIREFVDALPEAYRAVFVLSELDGLKNQEIADILELSLPTVKIRLHRAKAQLKQKMVEGCCLYYDEQNRLACDRKM